MTMVRLLATLGTALLAAGAAQAGCYTVMDPQGAILSQTSTPPVDMSRSIDETVPERFGPGARMTFGIAERDCGPLADIYADNGGAATRRSTRTRTRSPHGMRRPKADRG